MTTLLILGIVAITASAVGSVLRSTLVNRRREREADRAFQEAVQSLMDEYRRGQHG